MTSPKPTSKRPSRSITSRPSRSASVPPPSSAPSPCQRVFSRPIWGFRPSLLMKGAPRPRPKVRLTQLHLGALREYLRTPRVSPAARRPSAAPGRRFERPPTALSIPHAESGGIEGLFSRVSSPQKRRKWSSCGGDCRGRPYPVGKWMISLTHEEAPLFSPTSFCHLDWPPFLFPEEHALRPYHSSSRWAHLAGLVVEARLQFFALNLILIVRSLRLSSSRKRGINNKWNSHIKRRAAAGSPS